MIATISPDAQFTDESVSTCHFAQRVALVKNSATVNEEIEPELVIQRLRAEVRRLREEVEFLSRKHDDDDGVGGEKQNCELSRQQMCELTDSIRKYVHDCEKFSRLDFCGGITLPRIRAVCAIFKDFLLRKRNEMIVDDDESKSDKESSEKNEISFAPTTANSQVVKESSDKNNASNKGDRNRTPAPNENKIEKENTSKVNCICGVPMCKDQQVIAEPNLAFAWFKDRYPETKAIDENKDLLKTKITEV
jgi:kinesin family protein 6/9